MTTTGSWASHSALTPISHASQPPTSHTPEWAQRAVRTPEVDLDSFPNVIFALSPLVYTVPPEQHDHARKQSQYLLFKFRWRYPRFASKLVGQLLKIF